LVKVNLNLTHNPCLIYYLVGLDTFNTSVFEVARILDQIAAENDAVLKKIAAGLAIDRSQNGKGVQSKFFDEMMQITGMRIIPTDQM
jgi:hypothetical protein